MAKKLRKTTPPPIQNTVIGITGVIPDRTPWHRVAAVRNWLLLLLGGTLLVYLPTFYNGFTNWDDDLYVEKNRLVTNFDVPGMFGLEFGKALAAAIDKDKIDEVDPTPFVAGNYHPLTVLSLAINYRMSALDPWSYQATNILLHLLNTFLAFLLLLRLSGRKPLVALIGAAIFGLHPMHVESVTWMAERKDVLYTAFFFGGLLQYLQFRKSRSPLAYSATLLLFVLSCLSKPAAVVFPLVLMLIDWWEERKLPVAHVVRYVPFLAGSVLFGLLTLTAQINSNAYGGLLQFNLLERIAMAGYGWVLYVGRLFLPIQLSAFYPYPKEITALYYVALAAAAAMGAWALWVYRKYPYVTFGMLFGLINLLLVLQFVTVGSAIVADRYTYVPYLGFGFLLGYVLYDWANGRWPSIQPYGRTVRLAFVGALAIFGVLTAVRATVWKTSETVFTNVIKNYPNAIIAWNNRGHHYRQLSGRAQDPATRQEYLSKALNDYNEALTRDPKYHLAYANRAKVWFEQQNFQQAIADYSKAIEYGGTTATSYCNRGAAYASIQQFETALLDFNEAEKKDPNYQDIYLNRGLTYMSLQRYPEAIADYQRYLQFKPTHAGIMNSIGICYQGLNDHASAINEFSRAIQTGQSIGDDNVKVYYINRSVSYRASNNPQQALQDARTAQQLGYPVNPEYLRQLGG